jgi:hypothetical protein
MVQSGRVGSGVRRHIRGRRPVTPIRASAGTGSCNHGKSPALPGDSQKSTPVHPKLSSTEEGEHHGQADASCFSRNHTCTAPPYEAAW